MVDIADPQLGTAMGTVGRVSVGSAATAASVQNAAFAFGKLAERIEKIADQTSDPALAAKLRLNATALAEMASASMPDGKLPKNFANDAVVQQRGPSNTFGM